MGLVSFKEEEKTLGSCLDLLYFPFQLQFQFLWNIVLYSTGLYFHHQTQPQLSFCFGLATLFLINLDSILKIREITLLTKVHIVKAIVFPVVMHRCESWTIKKAECWRTDVFELWCWRTLWRVPWTARRSNQSILKKINPEYSLEGLAEAEARILWPPDVKSWLTGKNPDAGKDWRQNEKRAAENEMVRGHHRLNGHEFDQTLGDSGGQRNLACYNPWGGKESDMTQWLNNNNKKTAQMNKVIYIKIFNVKTESIKTETTQVYIRGMAKQTGTLYDRITTALFKVVGEII